MPATKRLMSKQSLRNLPQYKNLTEEEFEERYMEYSSEAYDESAFEEKIQKELAKYAEAYDLQDMMPNDEAILRGLVRDILTLEEYEKQRGILTMKGVSAENIITVQRLSDVMTALKKSISDAQNDLRITRKVRRSQENEDTLTFLESLKTKAKMFYNEKMLFLICPVCNTKLGSIYITPELQHSKRNHVTVYCNRVGDDGVTCKGYVDIALYKLYEAKQTSNKPEVLPEELR